MKKNGTLLLLKHVIIEISREPKPFHVGISVFSILFPANNLVISDGI